LVSKWIQEWGWKKENIRMYPGEFLKAEWINDLSTIVKPNDEFLFYYQGHGTHYGGNALENKLGTFTYTVHPKKPWQFPYEMTVAFAEDEGITNGIFVIYDDALAEFFKVQPWQDVKKTFVIDSCFSGGFWGGDDLDETGDLERLNNVRFIASSGEDELTSQIWNLTDTVLKPGLHEKEAETGIECEDTEAFLTGVTFDGQLIKGVDSINTVKCR
jgi:hypothetical protein